MTENPCLTAALGYAAHGYEVFPTAVETKAPLTPHGVKDASTDPDVIARWWTTYPNANVAIRPPAGVFVIDVDTEEAHGHDGFATLAALVEELGPLPPDAPKAITRSGGWHIWLSGADDVIGGFGKGSGVDIKSRGGYVIVPPSAGYRWEAPLW